MTVVKQIKKCIEEQLERGKIKFIIFPYGDIGMQIKNILIDAYGLQPAYIIDNSLYNYNPNIKSVSLLEEINCQEYCLLLATLDKALHNEMKKMLLEYFAEADLGILEEMKSCDDNYTVAGKYSYGPLCNHWLVESVGAFCSFSNGTDVTENHAIDYISTHPFVYYGNVGNEVLKEYEEYRNHKWFFPNVIPKGKAKKLRRIQIGNDVWLGKNVTITNGANIGNGVIAGAGAVITKDVPDYAIVTGVPAKIVRYRYTEEQIKALNEIQWWNWSDEEIRERYEDFYLPIEEFIEKYKVN